MSDKDISKLIEFRDRVIKDFSLTEKIDKDNNHCLYFNGFLVLKLLERKSWWYGVCREIPEKDNIWRAFRVKSTEDEKSHYDHIKTFVKINSE